MTKDSLMEQVRKDAESFEKYPEWKKSALTLLMEETKLEAQAQTVKKADADKQQ